MEMPIVNTCAAEDCAYNTGRRCHALAITIGDSQNPQCDTYIGMQIKGGDRSSVGHVGACKVSMCVHNFELECRAPGITVGFQSSSADCLTYQSV